MTRAAERRRAVKVTGHRHFRSLASSVWQGPARVYKSMKRGRFAEIMGIRQAQGQFGAWPRPARPGSVMMPRSGPARREKSTGQRARCLAQMGGDRIHKDRREAVIGLQTQLTQPRTDAIHLIRRRAGLDDRGDESGELGG